jgi:hypothetical protein
MIGFNFSTFPIPSNELAAFTVYDEERDYLYITALIDQTLFFFIRKASDGSQIGSIYTTPSFRNAYASINHKDLIISVIVSINFSRSVTETTTWLFTIKL